MTKLGALMVVAAVAAVAVVLGASSCGKADAPAAPAGGVPGGGGPVEGGTPTAVQRPALILAYDTLREALASDDLAATKAAATKLAEIARSEKVDPIATAAGQVAETTDIEQARLAFGHTSKAWLEHLQSKPDLAQGLIAYRCPMAEGYQKWVQVGPPMRNPYMGKKMLECGSKVDLVP